MKKTNSLILKLTAVLALILIVFISSCKKDTKSSIIPTPPINNISYSLGCEMLPASEYAKIEQAKPITLKTLPASVNLVVPPVGNQGSEGSCVAFGTTYAGRSINWQAAHPGVWSNTANVFSPEYVYNQIKINASCGSGSYVTSGLNLLKTKGACKLSTMPYVDGQCSLAPNSAQNTDAANYKIAGYSTLPPVAATIKTYLAAGKPVIVAGPVNNAYMYLANNAILGNFVSPSLGGHCSSPTLRRPEACPW